MCYQYRARSALTAASRKTRRTWSSESWRIHEDGDAGGRFQMSEYDHGVPDWRWPRVFVFVFMRVVGPDRDRAITRPLVVVATYYGLFAIMGGWIEALVAESTAAALFAATVIGFRRNLGIVAGLRGTACSMPFTGTPYQSRHATVVAYNGGSIDVAMGIGPAWLLLRTRPAEAP
jgi:hypothetical protein